MFHAFSGCDTTSAFNGKGKKSVWQAWQVFEDVTETFVYLAGHPFQLLDAEDGNFLKIERMTVILYDKTRPLSSVNETRRELFCHKNRAMDKLTPTKDALLQHTRPAVYQAGVWTMSTQTHLVVPSPQDFVWTKVSESWVPVWMIIPEVSSQMFLQGRLHQLQMQQCESQLLTTLQVQMYCIELCKMVINLKEITMQHAFFNIL